MSICSCFISCKASSVKYYSYVSVTSSSIDSVKTPLGYTHLISYGKFIFEFNIRTNIEEIGYLNRPEASSRRITGFDTLSLYLLNGENRLFYEFDTFALNNRLIKVAKWKDKPAGQELNLFPAESKGHFLRGPANYELINNVPCFVSKTTKIDDRQSDSISFEEILVKNVHLNSYFKICGTKFPDDSYCIIGYRVINFKRREGEAMEIENLRPLNEKEIAICKNMVRIMGTAVTDTVGNYRR